jgi:hypothetical protein
VRARGEGSGPGSDLAALTIRHLEERVKEAFTREGAGAAGLGRPVGGDFGAGGGVVALLDEHGERAHVQRLVPLRAQHRRVVEGVRLVAERVDDDGVAAALLQQPVHLEDGEDGGGAAEGEALRHHRLRRDRLVPLLPPPQPVELRLRADRRDDASASLGGEGGFDRLGGGGGADARVEVRVAELRPRRRAHP